MAQAPNEPRIFSGLGPMFNPQFSRAFASINHPADTCDFYASTIGESTREAIVHDYLTFTEALLNDTVNCILFSADIVLPYDFFEPQVRPNLPSRMLHATTCF